jgi:DNA helicase IV
MDVRTDAISPEARRIVDEEAALLERVSRALSRAIGDAAAREASAPSELRSLEALRALREEAATASDADLPPLLLELGVRQKLLERPASAPLPSPLCPYLAHLRLREGSVAKDYLLGHASFLDAASGVRVVDWRVAPVAQLFYRYREGDEYEEELPGRVAEGVVEARRILVIERGELAQILGDGLALARRGGAWVELAGPSFAAGGAGSAARPGVLGVGAGVDGAARPTEVTALLDAEQYEAVCAPPEQPLVVLGTAGSGKTTVALHRLARLVARDGVRFPAGEVRVVVPEEGLARLSRRLLEPLGIAPTQVATLDAWATALSIVIFGKASKLCDEPPALVTSLKRHPALYDALGARFARTSAKGTTLGRLRRKLADALTDRGFLAGVVDAARGDLSRACIEETVRHTLLQIGEPLERELESIVVPELKVAIDGRPIAEATPDELAGTIDVEDLPILLHLRASRGPFEAAPIPHLVLDEAEDLALFELDVLGRLLQEPKSVTLAGDEAQTTTASFAGWSRALDVLGAGDAVTCRLAVSYRCPQPVVEAARAILGPLAPDEPARAARDGAPVGVFHFPDDAQALLFLHGALRDLALREPRASVAVVARDEAAARRVHEGLGELDDVRLSLGGALPFEPGIDVTDVDSVKGLEFDYVVVPDATAAAYPATAEARRRLHVAATRASHQLWLLSSGLPSPLVPRPSESPFGT